MSARRVLDTLALMVGGAVDLAGRVLRRSSPPRTMCTAPKAVDDFKAILDGSLDANGLARFARHTTSCLTCQELLTTVVLVVGLRRVVGAGMHDLARARKRAQA